jgi:DNA-binding IclR family transcriptional regulator
MDHDRPQGFIRAAEEFEHDIHELAVPVRDQGGRVTAALTVLGSSAALEDSAEEIAGALHSAARRLAAAGSGGGGVS